MADVCLVVLRTSTASRQPTGCWEARRCNSRSRVVHGFSEVSAAKDSSPGDPGRLDRLRVIGVLHSDAALRFHGRALALYCRTFPTKRKCSPKAEHEFLLELAQIIPSHCSPILVTDAGFLAKWFHAVAEIGWDFVGRLRGRRRILMGDDWLRLEDLHALAGRKPKDLGICGVYRSRKRSAT